MRLLLPLLCCVSGALASCTSTSGRGDPVVSCMIAVNPPGSYGYADGTTPPVLVPQEGGTQDGADAVNACLRARVGPAQGSATGAAPVSVSPAPAPRATPVQTVARVQAPLSGGICPAGAPVIYRGTTYCPGT